MSAFLRFMILFTVKICSRLCFRHQLRWIQRPNDDHWKDVRLILVLNHTSLFEPLYTAHMPTAFLWRVAREGMFPGADITLDQPIAGFLFRLLAADAVTITRQRDESWSRFLAQIHSKRVVLLTPEGRMKREDGLDKHGQPMTVRGGVADILLRMHGGQMIIAYSGGLHHVAPPGARFPSIGKTLALAIEAVDIDDYKRVMGAGQDHRFKLRVIADLEARRDRHCPAPPA